MSDRTRVRVLVPGKALGQALVLDEPLSFWGGLDAATGEIIDRHHPQAGETVTGRIVVMARGRGSSSGSSVLAESIRAGTGPTGLILGEADEIVALGAIVADEIYGIRVPIVVASADFIAKVSTGDRLTMSGGLVGFVPGPNRHRV